MKRTSNSLARLAKSKKEGKPINGSCRYTSVCGAAKLKGAGKGSCPGAGDNIECCIEAEGLFESAVEKVKEVVSDIVPDNVEKAVVKVGQKFATKVGDDIKDFFLDTDDEATRKAKERVAKMEKSTDTGYKNDEPFQVELVTVRPFRRLTIPTAIAFEKMSEAASAAQITLRINAAFRTKKQQQDQYRLFRAGKGNLDSPHGRSSLQTGTGLCLHVQVKEVKEWVERNAKKFGFCRTVPGNEWHYQYFPDTKECPEF